MDNNHCIMRWAALSQTIRFPDLAMCLSFQLSCLFTDSFSWWLSCPHVRSVPRVSACDKVPADYWVRVLCCLLSYPVIFYFLGIVCVVRCPKWSDEMIRRAYEDSLVFNYEYSLVVFAPHPRPHPRYFIRDLSLDSSCICWFLFNMSRHHDVTECILPWSISCS